MLHAIVAHGDGSGVEGVGLQDICPGVQVSRVNCPDDRRLGQRQEVVVALEITGPIPELLTSVVLLSELVTLDHGAHCAVQHQYPPGKQLLQLSQPPRAAASMNVRGFGSGGGYGHFGRSPNKKPEAKTPQVSRFSSLFNVAAISANRHDIISPTGKLTDRCSNV